MHRCAAFRFLSIFPLLVLFFSLSYTPCRANRDGDTTTDAAAAQTAAADEFFGQSTLVGSTTSLLEGETVTNTLTVRYRGEENPMPISVVFPIPQPAMFVSASPAMSPPDDKRETRWEGAVERGKDLVFSVTLIALPDSAGSRTLMSSAAICWQGHHDGPNWQGGVHWVQTETEIHSSLQPQDMGRQGEKTLSLTEATVFAYLVGGPLLIVLIPWLIRRREQNRQRDATESSAGKKFEGFFLYVLSFAFVALVGIAHLMSYLVVEDYRRLYAYRQSECTVLDKRISEHVMKARAGQTQSRDTQISEPMVAVRYSLDEMEHMAAGPPEVTSMRSPSKKTALRQLARFEIGRTYPCWIDPRHPAAFYLIRGISWGWYLLCTGPVILLFFLARYLRRRVTG